jgi:1-phosphofructokinase
MIVTVTLNPSLDRTIQVERLVRGAVHRAGAVRLDAGGKGVNIARALAGNGHKVRAVFPKGGADGDELAWLLSRAGIDYRAVPIGDAVRTNMSVVEPDGTVTKLNTPGPVLTAAEIDALIAATLEAAAGAGGVVCSGPRLYVSRRRRLRTACRSLSCSRVRRRSPVVASTCSPTSSAGSTVSAPPPRTRKR